MPPISRYLIRASLVNFVAGSVAGVLWTFAIVPQPVYYHLLVFGWVTQMIMGVSIWMFPQRKKEGAPGLLILLVAVNVGLILRIIGETAPPGTWGMSPVLVASGLLQWIAAFMYVVIIWRRVS